MSTPEPQERRTPEPRADRRDRRTAPAVTERVKARQSLFQRFRRPIIGLGLAGAALPMVQATTPAASDDTDPADSPNLDPNAVTTADSTEEQIAARIAVTREEQERSQHIQRAVEAYDISEELAADIYDIAREENVDPKLAYGLVRTESTFNERAISHVGARGLTQVMPRTARWLLPGTSTEDLYNRQTNLRLGFRYLDQMIDKYKGDVRLALLAYNRGPGTVDKVLKKGGNPDNGYADKVLKG